MGQIARLASISGHGGSYILEGILVLRSPIAWKDRRAARNFSVPQSAVYVRPSISGLCPLADRSTYTELADVPMISARPPHRARPAKGCRCLLRPSFLILP